MNTFVIGDLQSAYLAMMIPVVAVLLLGGSTYARRDSYRRRFQGWRLIWETWGQMLLISLALFGVFYWYLFWTPFYAATVTPDDSWTLTQVWPEREVTLQATNIADFVIEEERLPIIRLRWRRERVRIVLEDGRSYVSAPVDKAESTQLFSQLQTYIP